jgi:hypothetical protein
MNALSTLFIFLGMFAAIGLAYELTVEYRRAQLRARSQREWQRLTAHPMARSQGGKQ